MSDANQANQPPKDAVSYDLATVLNEIQLIDAATDTCKSIWEEIDALPDQ